MVQVSVRQATVEEAVCAAHKRKFIIKSMLLVSIMLLMQNKLIIIGLICFLSTRETT